MPPPGPEPAPHPRRAGAPPRRERAKTCETCRQIGDLLYRARGDAGSAWRFYCRACLLRLKAGNPGYSYGGTWKRKKKG